MGASRNRRGGVTPSGDISITENGYYNVTQYAGADVLVSAPTTIAFIDVTYSSGKTVTCTDGVTTYTSDTSGHYIFALENTGTWTVSSDYFTETVTAQYGQSYTINTLTLLRYSNYANILAEVYRGSFEIGVEEIAPNLYAHNYSLLSLDANNDLVTTTDTHLWYDRETDVNNPITIYFAGKSLNSSGSPRIATALYANSADGAPGLYQKNGNVWTTKYGSDINTGISSSNNIFAGAISLSGTTAKYYVNGTYTETKTYVNTTGRYVYFSGSGNPDNPNVTTAYAGTFEVAHIGIVNGAETDTVINNNLLNILSYMANN